MSNSKDNYSKLVIYQRKDNDLGVIRGHCPHFFFADQIDTIQYMYHNFLRPDLYKKRMMPINEALQDPSVYVHMESLEALVVFPCKKKYLLNIIL